VVSNWANWVTVWVQITLFLSDVISGSIRDLKLKYCVGTVWWEVDAATNNKLTSIRQIEPLCLGSQCGDEGTLLINQDNVYGAVFTERATATVHPVHLMNVVQCWMVAYRRTKPATWAASPFTDASTHTVRGLHLNQTDVDRFVTCRSRGSRLWLADST